MDEAKNRHLLPKRTLGYLSERMTPRYGMVTSGSTTDELDHGRVMWSHLPATYHVDTKLQLVMILLHPSQEEYGGVHIPYRGADCKRKAAI